VNSPIWLDPKQNWTPLRWWDITRAKSGIIPPNRLRWRVPWNYFPDFRQQTWLDDLRGQVLTYGAGGIIVKRDGRSKPEFGERGFVDAWKSSNTTPFLGQDLTPNEGTGQGEFSSESDDDCESVPRIKKREVIQ